MTKINLESLPELVSKKVVSKTQAVNIVWEELYMNPHKYGLNSFSEDQKSDFLIIMHGIFEKIFDKFIPGGSVTFTAFITGCIANYKMAFLRRLFEEENEMKSISAILRNETEEKTWENRLNLPEDLDENEAESLQEKKTFSQITKKASGQAERNKKVAELTALVLLMKACKDIDDETIERVSKFTGIDKGLLFEKIQALRDSMLRKDCLNQDLIARRNNAFFFHRKYMQEMLVPSYAEKKHEILKSKYEKQTKKWQIHNKLLSVRSNSPSNEEIAKIIGLKPRTVSFYINHAKSGKGLRKIRELQTEKNGEAEKEKLASETGSPALE